jgi:hypothetical protein
MNHEDAKILTKQHKNNPKVETIIVTGDGSVYLNGNIRAIEKHAKENNLELFQVKPEKLESKTTKK